VPSLLGSRGDAVGRAPGIARWHHWPIHQNQRAAHLPLVGRARLTRWFQKRRRFCDRPKRRLRSPVLAAIFRSARKPDQWLDQPSPHKRPWTAHRRVINLQRYDRPVEVGFPAEVPEVGWVCGGDFQLVM